MTSGRKALMIAMFGVSAAAPRVYADQGTDMTAARDTPKLVAGNTRFALAIYGQMRACDGNLFFSPMSISTALAMTYAGAAGETAREMRDVLHFDLKPDRLHAAFARLIGELDAPKDSPGWRLHVANALWAQQGYEFLPDFLAIGQTHYQAELRVLDFAAATERARRTINTWVKNRTEGKIKELITKGLLDPLTRLVLTNAIYFKGNWAAEFDKERTADAPFKLKDGTTVKAPLMSRTGDYGYLEQPDCQVLELPYAGDALSMVIVLPRRHDGLAELEKSLDAKKLTAWIDGLGKRKVHVALPRFRMTFSVELKDVLEAMGMRAAFGRRADFSGMDGSKMLYISAVVHKAFVDVSEEGTEAAAATAVVMRMKSAAQPTPVFRADHPFLFLIRDTRSGSILFIGRVENPAS